MSYSGVKTVTIERGGLTFRCIRFIDADVARSWAAGCTTPHRVVLGDDETAWLVRPNIADKLEKMGYEVVNEE